MKKISNIFILIFLFLALLITSVNASGGILMNLQDYPQENTTGNEIEPNLNTNINNNVENNNEQRNDTSRVISSTTTSDDEILTVENILSIIIIVIGILLVLLSIAILIRIK